MVKAWALGAMLAAIFVFVAAPTIVPLVWSIDRVYQLRSVMVKDAVEGQSPAMLVDRTIVRDFLGRFDVQIIKATGSEFEVYRACGPHRSAWFPYRERASLPADLDLDWWIDIPPNPPCNLAPGQYRIITTVYAKAPLGAEVSIERISNLFTIWPKP